MSESCFFDVEMLVRVFEGRVEVKIFEGTDFETFFSCFEGLEGVLFMEKYGC